MPALVKSNIFTNLSLRLEGFCHSAAERRFGKLSPKHIWISGPGDGSVDDVGLVADQKHRPPVVHRVGTRTGRSGFRNVGDVVRPESDGGRS